jgi:dihydropteroate synthase
MVDGRWWMDTPILKQDRYDPERFILNCRGRTLDCRPGLELGAHVMGVLNVTPDSFYDGGRFTGVDTALRRVEEMIGEGAAIIDVGGESTRPRGSVYGEGAEAVPAEAERARVLPIIEALSARFPEILISIDTYKPDVARAALEAGAHIVNDVTGLRFSPETAEVAAAAGAPLIVMHSLGRPGEMPHEHRYADVAGDVHDFLEEATRTAEAAGVRHVIVDPGFGFGKSVTENLHLLRNVHGFLRIGRPVLVGVSRKSSIGAVLGAPEAPVPAGERLFGSLGATAVAVVHGATLVRTHDVRATVEMLRVMAAVLHA